MKAKKGFKIFKIILGGKDKPMFMEGKDLKDVTISSRLVFGKDIISIIEVK